MNKFNGKAAMAAAMFGFMAMSAQAVQNPGPTAPVDVTKAVGAAVSSGKVPGTCELVKNTVCSPSGLLQILAGLVSK